MKITNPLDLNRRLARTFHAAHETPTAWSAGLQPALGETSPPSRLQVGAPSNACEISGLGERWLGSVTPLTPALSPSGGEGARRAGEGAATDLTLSGQVLGSPGYLPPAQATGHRGEVGPTSDVYALGAILYCLLTGRAPFQGETVTDVLEQVLNAEPLASIST